MCRPGCCVFGVCVCVFIHTCENCFCPKQLPDGQNIESACAFQVQQPLSDIQQKVLACSQQWWNFVRGAPKPNKSTAVQAAKALKEMVDKLTQEAHNLLQVTTSSQPNWDKKGQLKQFFERSFHVFKTTSGVCFPATRQQQLLNLLDKLDEPLVFWLAQCPAGFEDQVNDSTLFGKSQNLMIQAYEAIGPQSTDYMFSDGS